MKQTILYIATLAAFSFTSCEMNKTEEKDSLTELKEKRDSLKTEFNKLNAEIKTLDLEIDKLSPEKKLYIVNTIKASKKDFKHYIEVQGNVNSDQSISMYPELGGLVNKVFVKEGQKVKKGQVLVKFDSDVLEKSRQEIETSLELAKTTYDRQKKLWKQKIGSEIEYLQSKSNLETMKSKKAALNAQIEQTKITATFSGVIDEIFIKEGEMTAPTMPALRLINLDNVYIEADVSEKYLRDIKKGTRAKVIFPNINKTYDSEISMTGNYINPSNRSFRIIVDIDNKKHLVKPNQIAVLNLLDFEQNGVVIPTNVILNGPDGNSFVYSVSADSGTSIVKKVIVKKGPSYNNETLIIEGLNSNSVVVNKGSRSIQDGQKVRIEK